MLTDDERTRYDRHLRLDEFGSNGQERLLASSALVVGAGGLGSPALLYLAAAGVGRIGIVDDDVVDRSNLQRQVVHRDRDVGESKARSAARAIAELNPGARVDVHDLRLNGDNARDLLRRYDLVLDGTDELDTRYLLADAAYLEGVPLVHGSVHRFEGQVTVFASGVGPCYRCLFPHPPPVGSLPSCAETGVLGVLPGTVGMIQATEAIKILAGIGTPLIGRLLRYDALHMRWNELRLGRDPTCPLCGDAATITDVAARDGSRAADGIERLSASAYDRLRARGEEHLLLDVREPAEVAAWSVPGGRNIPLGDLPERLPELHEWRDRLVVCGCASGVRSLEAAGLLREAGFTRVANLDAGLGGRHPRAVRR